MSERLVVNSTIQATCKSRTKMISAFDQNRSRIKGFRKPERSDVDEALLKWFKEESSDNLSVSGLLLVRIFVLHKF